MFEGPIQDLIDELARLPGIGPKSAQRMAFYLVKAPVQDARRLAEAIVGAKERVRFCRECFSVSEGELCRICRDPGRDLSVICVVEEPKDQAAIEKAGVIRGRYHVLGEPSLHWRGSVLMIFVSRTSSIASPATA